MLLQLYIARPYLPLHMKFSFSQSLTAAAEFTSFLDASTHLYKRVCPSVGPSVGWLVAPSVGNAFVPTPKMSKNGQNHLQKHPFNILQSSKLVKKSRYFLLQTCSCNVFLCLYGLLLQLQLPTYRKENESDGMPSGSGSGKESLLSLFSLRVSLFLTWTNFDFPRDIILHKSPPDIRLQAVEYTSHLYRLSSLT